MTNEELKKANEIKEKISELKSFLNVFDYEKAVVRGSGNKFINGFVLIETQKKVKIFGSRSFLIGRHTTELEIPNTVIEDLEKFFKQRLEALEIELSEL